MKRRKKKNTSYHMPQIHVHAITYSSPFYRWGSSDFIRSHSPKMAHEQQWIRDWRPVLWTENARALTLHLAQALVFMCISSRLSQISFKAKVIIPISQVRKLRLSEATGLSSSLSWKAGLSQDGTLLFTPQLHRLPESPRCGQGGQSAPRSAGSTTAVVAPELKFPAAEQLSGSSPPVKLSPCISIALTGFAKDFHLPNL